MYEKKNFLNPVGMLKCHSQQSHCTGRNVLGNFTLLITTAKFTITYLFYKSTLYLPWIVSWTYTVVWSDPILPWSYPRLFKRTPRKKYKQDFTFTHILSRKARTHELCMQVMCDDWFGNGMVQEPNRKLLYLNYCSLTQNCQHLAGCARQWVVQVWFFFTPFLTFL